MANLIFSRSASNLPLTTEEIVSRAPSVYSTTHSMSPRYGQVTTANAIGILADFGFYPVQAAQKGKGRHKAHLLAFASSPLDSTEGRPELILYNSHDGSSSLKMFAGFYRFICSNGIVAGDGFESRLRHTSGTVNGFENLVTSTAGRLPLLVIYPPPPSSKPPPLPTASPLGRCATVGAPPAAASATGRGRPPACHLAVA